MKQHIPALIFPENVLDQHLVVLGKTGAGKSSALRHIVEHLLSRKKRVCVIDPKGDWHGLKVAADGKNAGFPIILFGDFKETAGKSIPADVPLNEYSGKHVAELVTSGNRPCVIGLRGWTMAAMHRFWVEFASTFFNTNEGEIYLVVDEVHNFAPKGSLKGKEGNVTNSLHWTNRLLSEARGLGAVMLIASQRPQKVHNDTLTACETLVAMRVIHKADRDAIEDWIKGNGDKDVSDEVLNSLAGMKRGEAYVWSPEVEFGPERLTFPMFTTFDSFAPPQLQKKVSGKDWASVDLDEVKAKLSAVIEKAKAEDPRELQKQIRSLTLDLQRERASQAESKPTEVVKEIETPVVSDLQVENLKQSAELLAGLLTRFTEGVSALSVIATEVHDGLAKLNRDRRNLPNATEVTRQGPIVTRRPVHVDMAPRVQHLKHDLPLRNGDFRVSSSQQRILDSLAWLESIGLQSMVKNQVALMADASPTSSTYLNNLGALRSAGLVDYPSPGNVALTDAGRAAANGDDAPASNDELHRQIYSKLTSSQTPILRELISVYPQPLKKEELAGRVGASLTSSTYLNNLGRLRSLKLIDYPQTGYAVATPILFIE